MSDVARHYDASKADGSFIPGVPLADIPQATYDAYPKHVQQAIDESPLYRKTAVRAASASSTKADTKAKEE